MFYNNKTQADGRTDGRRAIIIIIVVVVGPRGI